MNTKNQKKLEVSIGIPAYNEEANIGYLLHALLAQKEKNFTLKEIIVVSDGSTDKTAEITRSFTDIRIRLIVNKSRKGQVSAQNIIFTIAKSDVVVLLEADTIPLDINYLARLIEPIVVDNKIGLVQGNLTPLPARTSFGSVLKAQTDIYHNLSIKDRDVSQWITSGRGGRVFARHVYEKLRWPNAVPEDSYALLWCRSRGIPTVFQKSAVCNFCCPETFSDLLKTRAKIMSGKKSLEKYFDRDTIEKIYNRPRHLRMRMFAEFILKYPFYAIYYLWLLVALKFFQNSKPFSDFSEMTISTKNLNIISGVSKFNPLHEPYMPSKKIYG
ncbi:MAG: glycosyltransferase family 2 protein [Patescibacteria group bacterium]